MTRRMERVIDIFAQRARSTPASSTSAGPPRRAIRCSHRVLHLVKSPAALTASAGAARLAAMKAFLLLLRVSAGAAPLGAGARISISSRRPRRTIRRCRRSCAIWPSASCRCTRRTTRIAICESVRLAAGGGQLSRPPGKPAHATAGPAQECRCPPAGGQLGRL